jgi:hypothetical protein
MRVTGFRLKTLRRGILTWLLPGMLAESLRNRRISNKEFKTAEGKSGPVRHFEILKSAVRYSAVPFVLAKALFISHRLINPALPEVTLTCNLQPET